MPEEATESAHPNGTTANDANVLNAAVTQVVPTIQEPAATRRAIITNAHVLERVTGQNHSGEHSGDDSGDEGPEPEVIANDEGMTFGWVKVDWVGRDEIGDCCAAGCMLTRMVE